MSINCTPIFRFSEVVKKGPLKRSIYRTVPVFFTRSFNGRLISPMDIDENSDLIALVKQKYNSIPQIKSQFWRLYTD